MPAPDYKRRSSAILTFQYGGRRSEPARPSQSCVNRRTGRDEPRHAARDSGDVRHSDRVATGRRLKITDAACYGGLEKCPEPSGRRSRRAPVGSLERRPQFARCEEVAGEVRTTADRGEANPSEAAP